MTQWAVCDVDDWVLGLVDSDTEPVADGRVFRLMQTPVASWPVPPSSAARLRWVAGTVQYVDLRTAAQAWADVRARRDALLAATDWRVTRALERSERLDVDWSVYRQALRDITLQADPFTVVWPAEPVSVE